MSQFEGNPTSLTIRKYQRVCSIASAENLNCMKSHVGVEMPHSLVLNLLPSHPFRPSFLSGRHLHALFSPSSVLYRQLTTSMKQKLTKLSPSVPCNQPTNQTIERQDSTLQWEHTKAIPAGTPCWWSLTRRHLIRQAHPFMAQS